MEHASELPPHHNSHKDIRPKSLHAMLVAEIEGFLACSPSTPLRERSLPFQIFKMNLQIYQVH
jgi:hypothetical protein